MKNNKGFSLIELLIVIAIMAIAIGLMAPQLIKYIEKTNVSSDIQLADTIRTGVTTSIVDAEVRADDASQPFLTLMESDTGPVLLGEISRCNDDNTDNRFSTPMGGFRQSRRTSHLAGCCAMSILRPNKNQKNQTEIRRS